VVEPSAGATHCFDGCLSLWADVSWEDGGMPGGEHGGPNLHSKWPCKGFQNPFNHSLDESDHQENSFGSCG